MRISPAFSIFAVATLCALLLCVARPVRAGSSGPAALKAGQSRRHVIEIENLKFKPATVEIEVGDIVVWVNNDDREHTVTARDGTFTSGNLASGKAYERKFDKPGNVDYGDELHPRMHGTVVVKAK